MKSETERGIYCNPTKSFDEKGNFHNLADYDSISFHFVEEKRGDADNDEEQGFEAVLDINHHLGRALRDDLTDSNSEVDPVEGQLYRREQVEQVLKDKSLNSTARRDAVFKVLETLGIKTFIVVSGHEDDTSEIIQRVRDVIDFVSILKRSHSPLMKCCLLFQDTDGLLYNLVFPMQEVGPFSQWQTNFNEFSGTQAISAVCLLVRVYSFIKSGEMVYSAPAFLGLILGMILREEMALCWMNTSLFVQGIPSTSSYILLNKDGSDWIHKISIACLVFAGAAYGNLRQILFFVGISLACAALLANLGSRVWHFLQWKPLSFCGPMAPFLSFSSAVLAGMFFPHLAHRDMESGGKAALEAATVNALWVSLIFVLSDVDAIQRLLLVGTERCDQQIINIVVGSWISLTLLLNLVLIVTLKKKTPSDGSRDLLLVQDQYSPVGYRVPSFPSFTIDPSNAKRSIPIVSLDQELYISILVALVILALLVSMAFTDWNKNLEQQIFIIFGKLYH